MIVALTMSVSSCSKDNYESHEFRLEPINIVSAELPDEFDYGRRYRIGVTIELPNSCYFYYDQYEYIYDGDTRLIYPIVHIDEGISCNQQITEIKFSIPVQVLQKEPYIFKFYQGKDADGEDTFLTIEVPVN
ncbi:hypothetical protein [Maribacter sp. 2308TA10-17]|uniref:hypothetical protein n=1 Tax=Maribacter sp. 2308TA10-17 TaxID=3386276 RepID=UPI0039BD7DFD